MRLQDFLGGGGKVRAVNSFPHIVTIWHHTN